jgi:hypothetical protein
VEKPNIRRAFLLTALLLTLASIAAGQGTSSRVTGTVLDQAGAAVPGAAVTLTNEATKVSFNSDTSGSGNYVFDSVQVGTYTVTIEKQGFKKFVSTGNQVNVNQPATIDVALEVGGISDVVTVQATAELVQTSSSGNFGNTVEQRALEALPIVGTRGRNPLQFVSLEPGVIGNGVAGTGGNTGGNVHVHGSRDRAFNFTLDGIDINESSSGGSNFTPLRPNPDSIQQFQVVTSNFTAELGRSSGAQVSLVTRSGSDTFHGTLFELYRSPFLNANEYENNLNGRGRGQFVQHIFGGSLGGPLFIPHFGEGGPSFLSGRKSKTYFFTNLQLLRATQSILVTRTVYTAQARAGLLRYRLGAANAPAGTSNPSIDASGNVLPSVNFATYNVVARDPLCLTNPTNCGLDPATQKLINAAPLPNNFFTGDGLNTAGFSFAAPSNESQWDFVTKVDHTFNDRNSIYVRYAQGQQNTLGDNGNGGLKSFPDSQFNFVDTFRNPKNLAFNYRWTPTARVTNELVLGFNQFAFSFNNPDPNGSQNPFILNLPRDPFNFTPPVNNRRKLTTYQLVDNLSFLSGAHTWRGGINLRFQKHDDIRSSVGGLNTNLLVNFSRTTNTPGTAFNVPATTGANAINGTDRNTFLSAINDLLGRYGNLQQAFVAAGDTAYAPAGTLFLFQAKYNEYDFYVQDSWKIRPNLTLDYGLRWEPKMAPRAGSDSTILVSDRSMRFGDPASDQVKWIEGEPFGDRWNNWAPTAGFAWDPWGNGKTSIRANYRLAYDRMNTFVTSSAIFPNTPGTSLGINNSSFATTLGEQARVRFGIPALVPPSTPGVLRQPAAFSINAITVFDPDTKFPRTHEWGVSIQREIGDGFVFEANYIGRRGRNLFGAYDSNQVDIFAKDSRCPETFLEGFNTLRDDQATTKTNTSCLINLLFTGSTVNNTGSSSFRTLFPTELTLGSVASAAFVTSQRTVAVGGVSQRMITTNTVRPSFFQPYSQFTGGVNVLDSKDYSRYHAFEFQVTRRASRGLLMQASYTWSRSLDTRSFDPAFTVVSRSASTTSASPSSVNTPFDIRNRNLNYALSDFDRKHALQGYAVYELPFGRHKKFLSDASGVLNQIIGGWELADAVVWQSGRPFPVFSGSFTVSNAVQSTANCSGCTANMGQVIQESGTNFIFSAAQRALFSTPAPGEQGNTGRNAFRGPRFFNMDMTVRKRFFLSESKNLEFRADINNLTNTVSFDFPISTTSFITSNTFGRIRDSVISNARRIQLGIKFNF